MDRGDGVLTGIVPRLTRWLASSNTKMSTMFPLFYKAYDACNRSNSLVLGALLQQKFGKVNVRFTNPTKVPCYVHRAMIYCAFVLVKILRSPSKTQAEVLEDRMERACQACT